MDGRRARKLLGVDRNASHDEIRRAFRARAILTHPDHGGNAHAFAELRVAFDLLRTSPPEPQPRFPLPNRGPRVDVYDSSPRPRPRRDFSDVLRGAMARDAQHVG